MKIPEKLQPGDEIRVIAPSRSLSIVRQSSHEGALRHLTEQGFRVTFGDRAREVDRWHSSSAEARVADLHDAFADPNVKAILTAIGGFNVNQILSRLDYDLIGRNPKILCGFSDITALLTAIHTKTGMVTYHGPHFSSFGVEKERKYTWDMFQKCVMECSPFSVMPFEAGSCQVLRPGIGEGQIVGGNLCTLNLLQGTPWFPDLEGKILFLEDDNIVGDYFCQEFDRNLQSLLHCKGGDKIVGLVLGQFDESCQLDSRTAMEIVESKIPAEIPVIFKADFGHRFPMLTFPVGGTARIDKSGLMIQEH